jgi:RNA polymerase sigma-70 factor (ECF subfamily)
MKTVSRLDEMELLAAVLSGPQRARALEEFQQRYSALVYACARRVLRRYGAAHTPDEVEDLVADLWLRLLDNDMERLRRFEPARKIKVSTWVGLITTNFVIDSLRRRRKYDSLDSVPEPTTNDSPQAALERRQEAAVAKKALLQLSQKDRSFFLACFHEERAPADLAKELGVSLNTIYSRKFKLRAKLMRIVEELCAPRVVARALA